MSALARIEARDAQPDPITALKHAWAKDASNLFQRIAALEGVLEAAKADLDLHGHLTRDTIRRVCRAVTPSADHQPRSAEQQPAAPTAPGAAGQEHHRD